MNPSGQMVCLNMIVKNEAGVIRRCLDSVRPIIDHWVIVDTGSTDGTQDIIREYFRDMPGELYERPWRDFAFNRSEALELARGKCDYTLIIDADDALEIRGDGTLPELDADSYMVTINDTAVVYQRPQLVRSALPWRYEGVLHEYLTCDGAAPHGQISAFTMRRNHDGARRKDPKTYRRDVDVLEAALQTEENPFLRARYRFYLAQSYRDCGDREKALENYLHRAELGFWQEEVFISLYSAAQLKEQLGRPPADIIDSYLRASDALTTRAEALHRASRYCREQGRYQQGYEIAKRGLGIALPRGALFVEPWIYEHGLLDEMALNAYWSGRHRDSLDASLRILSNTGLSAADVARVVENARFASEGLPHDPVLGRLGSESLTEQHALKPPRTLWSRLTGAPRVLVAIRASQAEAFLPLFRARIEALDYPKSAMVLSIGSHGSTDRTGALLRAWMETASGLYSGVEFEAEGGEAGTAAMRRRTLSRTLTHGCDFCLEVDVGHFLRSCTLRELVALNLPIVAPFLRATRPDDLYSNYHAETDDNGYYKECDQYSWALNRRVRGILEQPVVNGAYLTRADILGNLSFEDDTLRHEYVVFSEEARKRNIPQYLDNRQVYGYIVRHDDRQAAASIETARNLLSQDLPANGANGVSSRKVHDQGQLLQTAAL